MIFSIILIATTTLPTAGQENLILAQESSRVTQNEQEGDESDILTSTLGEPVGLQGFEGEHELSDDPYEIVEIIVQFHTPSAVALELIDERDISIPEDQIPTGDSFVEQAQSGHDEFWEQLDDLEVPDYIKESKEVFCETYWIFNGVHMRVPISMIEEIAELPEVFAVTPHILPELPILEEPLSAEPTEIEVPSGQPPARVSPFFRNDALMRNTRTRLNLDAVHLDMNITGRGVVVAAIDTGIDHNHPEFIRFHDRTGRVPGWQFYSGGAPSNHGTQTAGSIIAMAPQIELWSLQRSASGVSGGTAIGALNFATQTAKADVIYIWGWYPNSPFTAEAAAVSKAVEAGHIVVAAVHNQARPWSTSHQVPRDQWRENSFQGVTHNGITWQSVLNPLSPLAISVGAGTYGSDSNPTNTDNITNFSGRGPVPRTSQIKPDIITNGQWGWSTHDRRTGNSYGWFSGTSQAGPLATGITALLVQRFPNDAPYQIKARLMNTGRPITGVDMGNSSQHISAFSAGAGFARPYDALRSNTLVTVAHNVPLTANQATPWVERNMASFSFGSLRDILPNNARTFRATIHNKSNASITYTLSHEFVNNPGTAANITLSQRTITVGPGGTRHFYATISVAGNVTGNPAAFYEGHIHVRGGSHNLRLPFALVNPTTTNVAASRLSFNLQGGVVRLTTPDLQTNIDPINVPHGTNILTFLSRNHNGFAQPTRDGFTFGGWYLDANFQTPLTSSTVMPTSARTLYARWTSNVSNVSYTFNWGVAGVANPSGQVRYDTAPTAPTVIPANPGYTFGGWSPAVGPIRVATTFNAIWTPININYTFNWGIAGVANPSGQVRYNTAPTAPTTIPANPGYRFDGWTPAVRPITSATTFNAIWTPVNVNYTFNWGLAGVANPSGQVRYNTAPTAPTTIPANPGYRFDGWTPTVRPITSATTFNAIWTPININYTFNWGITGVANPSGQVRYNTAPTAPTTIPANPGYRFNGWNPIVGPIRAATTFNAIWEPVYVNYTFNWGITGVANPNGQVRYNTAPTPPATIPANPGYTFGGWNPVVRPITSATTFTAIWNQEIVTPACVNYIFDWGVPGVVNPSGQVRYNTTPTAPTDIPANPGYTFAGWNPVVRPITEDTVFTAVWTKDVVQPACVNYIFDWGVAGVANPSGQVKYNTAPTAPTNIPANPGYTFTGWNPVIRPITEDTVFTAVWTKDIVQPTCVSYIFDWGIAGVANPSGQVRYNTAPTAPTDIPANPGYTFAGWNPVVHPITEDTVFTAVWIPICMCKIQTCLCSNS